MTSISGYSNIIYNKITDVDFKVVTTLLRDN